MKNKILCIILVIPCITYIFLHAYHVKIIDGNQLSFIGAILGGLITLGGVWWTIKDNEKSKKRIRINVSTYYIRNGSRI